MLTLHITYIRSPLIYLIYAHLLYTLYILIAVDRLNISPGNYSYGIVLSGFCLYIKGYLLSGLFHNFDRFSIYNGTFFSLVGMINLTGYISTEFIVTTDIIPTDLIKYLYA